MLDPISLADDVREAGAFERAVLDGLESEVGFDAAFFAALGDVPTTVGIDPAALARAFGAHAFDCEIYLAAVPTGLHSWSAPRPSSGKM